MISGGGFSSTHQTEEFHFVLLISMLNSHTAGICITWDIFQFSQEAWYPVRIPAFPQGVQPTKPLLTLMQGIGNPSQHYSLILSVFLKRPWSHWFSLQARNITVGCCIRPTWPQLDHHHHQHKIPSTSHPREELCSVKEM